MAGLFLAIFINDFACLGLYISLCHAYAVMRINAKKNQAPVGGWGNVTGLIEVVCFSGQVPSLTSAAGYRP
jgi:hypothetical protein